ncbi:hypothetical protein BJ508DRAFT_334163 [Ascobolus immersus RN42]|uniref:Uncharacterized protein n=1 Tax=Ascobolus immersus RN42 TaxID=1160509 RepID=A0A3N4HH29_ASCIM|nr:hypothetical protein BJ508DRAFT_334163 [Ascobolus immersus RN42]
MPRHHVFRGLLPSNDSPKNCKAYLTLTEEIAVWFRGERLFLADCWVVMIRNEDKLNTKATLNALGATQNPHILPPPDNEFAMPAINATLPAAVNAPWVRLPRLFDDEIYPGFPTNITDFLNMDLAAWIRFADFHGWDWRTYRNKKSNKRMTVALARAKFAVRIGVYDKIPRHHFYDRNDAAHSVAEIEAAIALVGDAIIILPNHHNDNNFFGGVIRVPQRPARIRYPPLPVDASSDEEDEDDDDDDDDDEDDDDDVDMDNN